MDEWPLVAAFVILAAYTYSSGLRAPAVIAIVKDMMLYVMVLAALVVLPLKLGGYARVFELANQALATHTPAATIYLRQWQFLGYSTLAIGSAVALMLYPHTATAVLSAKSANTVRRNAAMLPAYSFLLGLIALLGYVALAAGVVTKDTSIGGAAAVSEDVSGVVCGVLPGGGGGGSAGAGGDYVDCGFEFVYAESVWRVCEEEDAAA